MTEITLARPEHAAEVTVTVEAGRVYALNFDIGAAEADVSGQGLVLRFDDGASLVLQNFFAVAAEADFYVRLADGTLLLGKDMADSFLLDLQNFVCGNGVDLDAGGGLAAYLGEHPHEAKEATPASLEQLVSQAVPAHVLDSLAHAGTVSGAASGDAAAHVASGDISVHAAPAPGDALAHAGGPAAHALEASPPQDDAASTEQYLRSLLLL